MSYPLAYCTGGHKIYLRRYVNTQNLFMQNKVILKLIVIFKRHISVNIFVTCIYNVLYMFCICERWVFIYLNVIYGHKTRCFKLVGK